MQLEEQVDRRLNVLQSHLRQCNQIEARVTSSTTQQQPALYKELVYVKKSNKYREATQIRERNLNDLRKQVEQSNGMLLVKNKFAGVQASVSHCAVNLRVF